MATSVGVSARAAEHITIDGSSGVMPLAMALAQAFQQRHPDVTVAFGKGLDPNARIGALAEGRIDIALASHGLNIGELGPRGLSVHEVARTAVVFGVNATVPVAELTEQQLCSLYSGQTPDWSALGGRMLPVVPLTRPDTEVDAEIVRDHVACLKAMPRSEHVKVMQRSGDMARALSSTAGAIGMTTMTVVEQSEGRVRAVSLNGLPATADNVVKRVYPLVRQAFFVARSAPRPTVVRFLEFVRGPDAQDVIRANGAIPAR
jgi:phosphate transport system substrate-binding protein